MRSSFRRIGLGLTCATGVLLFLELAFRLARVAPPLSKAYADPIYVPDPHLPYRPAPHISRDTMSRSGEFREVFTHNASGFRDVEHPRTKPTGTFRILGLGDSFTYGAGAPFDHTWLAILERKLNERPGTHPIVEIIKAGVGGYFPEAERLLLEHEGLSYAPDLVLVGFNPSDLFETWRGLDDVRLHDGFLKTATARRWGRIGTLLYLYSHAGRALLDLGMKVQRRRDMRAFEAERNLVWDKIEAEYDRMLALLPPGVPLVIVFIPFGHLPPPDDVARLRAYGDARRISVVDASPALCGPSQPGVSHFWPRDGHCTPQGYAVLAEVVLEALTRADLIP